MGPGDRLTYGWYRDCFILGICFSRFPYAFDITLNLGIGYISLGLGKPYTENQCDKGAILYEEATI